MSDHNGGAVPAGTSWIIDEDGQAEKGFIAAVPGQHPELRFEFRRMTADEQRQHSKAIRRLGDSENMQEYYAIAAKLIERHVKWWDVRRQDGAELPRNPETILKAFKPEGIARIVSILAGISPSDLDPRWDASEDGDETAMATGEKTPAQVDEERRKN